MTAAAGVAGQTRDADWRFLLPAAAGGTFDHLLLPGGSSSLASTIVDLGVARRVSTTVRAGDRADAAVILAGAPDTLDAVARELDDDGVLYWETDRRRHPATTPARAAQRLVRLGLQSTAAYWVKPGFPNRDMYLALGHAGAFRWYLDTLYRGTTRTRRGIKAALLALCHAGVDPGTLAPCFALTAVRGPARLPSLLARARAEDPAIPADAQTVLLAHGRAEWSRIALLVFHPGGSAPVRVVKCPRTPQFNGQTETEHHTLRRLAAQLPDSLRDSVPHSSLLHWNGLAVANETCMGGSALTTRAGGEGQAAADLALAARWLTAFHAGTVVEHAPAHAWLTRRLVDQLAVKYAFTFGLSGGERHLFETMGGALDAMHHLPLPIVWQHTDFGPWNVYRHGERAQVIDWEVARHGPALVDLLYFVTHWGVGDERVDQQARVRHAESIFCAPGPADGRTGAIRAEIADYMRRLNMAPALLPFLLLYTFVEQALDRAERLVQCAPGAAAGREANVYLGLIDMMARHADRLFPSEVPRAA